MRKALIAGGGTGGHVYPGLAIAEALRQHDPDLTIEFVGSVQGIENSAIPLKGFHLYTLPIGKFHASVGWKARLLTLLTLPWVLYLALRILLKTKPEFVLGMGGYASVPVVLLAALLRIPTYIWEANAHPGLANRVLSFLVPQSLIVFKEAKELMKSKIITMVGLPVRREIEDIADNTFHTKFHLLIFGGSLGAKGINDCLIQASKDFSWQDQIEIVHQTGAKDFQRVQSQIHSRPHWKVVDYIHNMHKLYEWADLIICRAGASTLAEIAAAGRASLLIPFPYASDDHQLKNAQAYAKMGAALIIEQKDLSANKLIMTIKNLRQNPGQLENLAQKAKLRHQGKAADYIATLLLNQGQPPQEGRRFVEYEQ